MRLRSVFGKREHESETLETRKKVFFVFEGDKTEDSYFTGFVASRKDLGINNCYDFSFVVKYLDERGWSNPKKILDRFILQAEAKRISFSELKQLLKDFVLENKFIAGNTQYVASVVSKAFETVFRSKPDMEINVDENKSNLEKVLQEIPTCSNMVDAFVSFINDTKIVYEKEIDKVCLIVDRDKKSFVEEKGNSQYTYVAKKCKEKGIDFYVTNPCFEFWLFLHFNDGSTLDFQKLIDNAKEEKTNETYIVQKLKEHLPHYDKSNLDFNDFKSGIDNAVANSQKYSTNIASLKDKVGTNLASLIQSLR